MSDISSQYSQVRRHKQLQVICSIYLMTDKQQSLEALEGEGYGDSSTAPTGLVKRCIELSKKPLDEFTASDLRVMIGQQFGLPYLVPIALEKLTFNLCNHHQTFYLVS